MKHAERHFDPPGALARAVNRLFGRLASIGLGPSYSFLLLTTGRRSGAPRATPVNLLRHEGKLFLVGTRGHTQWSRNAAAAGTVTLKCGRARIRFRVRRLDDEEKAAILKAYLSRFKWMVSRFFPVAAESPLDAFAAIAPRYPAFELRREN